MANDVQNVEELRKDLNELRTDMGKLTADLRAAINARLEDGLDAAKQFGRVAQRRAEWAAQEARHQVAEHPGAAIATAFGVGLALGLLIARPRN